MTEALQDLADVGLRSYARAGSFASYCFRRRSQVPSLFKQKAALYPNVILSTVPAHFGRRWTAWTRASPSYLQGELWTLRRNSWEILPRRVDYRHREKLTGVPLNEDIMRYSAAT